MLASVCVCMRMTVVYDEPYLKACALAQIYFVLIKAII